MKLGNKLFDERAKAGDLLVNAVNSNQYNNKVIGNINGFDIVPLPMNFMVNNRQVQLIGQGKYTVEISSSGVGSITRLENYISSLDERLESNKTINADLKKQLESAKVEVLKPFEYAEQIEQMSKELAELDAELDLNKKETLVLDDEELQKEQEPIVIEVERDIDDEDDESSNKRYADMEM